jgi:hypothetical protein
MRSNERKNKDKKSTIGVEKFMSGEGEISFSKGGK